MTIDGKDYRQGTAIDWEINYAYKVFGKGYLGSRIKFQQPVRWVEKDSRYLLEQND